MVNKKLKEKELISASNISSALKRLANKKMASKALSFFKTSPGQYGHGDKFLGIRVPKVREIAAKSKPKIKEINKLLSSPWHEERLVALIILNNYYKQANKEEKIFLENFYLKNLNKVNNWDLVDSSAHQILGERLAKNKKLFIKLLESSNLWYRRVAIVGTYKTIKENNFSLIIKAAEKIIKNKEKEDLIHKATGWMLREVGKRDKKTLIDFLKKYSFIMPRTMLRYAIEKMSKKERQAWLKK